MTDNGRAVLDLGRLGAPEPARRVVLLRPKLMGFLNIVNHACLPTTLYEPLGSARDPPVSASPVRRADAE